MDRRVNRTRNAIFEAFNHLLSHKKYAKITIQDIIDEADVGRSTFYTHFEAKEDLLHKMCEDLFAHIFSEELNEETSHDFSLKPGNLRNKLLHLLYHLKDNQKKINGLLNCESGRLFFQYFNSYLERLFQTNESTRFISTPPVASKEYRRNHMTRSFFETIRWWFNRQLVDAPETIVDYYLSVISFVL
ncbi:TetR/AcrR family transcriptional regulator [Fusibacter sp. JL298sf-3]